MDDDNLDGWVCAGWNDLKHGTQILCNDYVLDVHVQLSRWG